MFNKIYNFMEDFFVSRWMKKYSDVIDIPKFIPKPNRMKEEKNIKLSRSWDAHYNLEGSQRMKSALEKSFTELEDLYAE